jgi:hypothetical protein
VAQGSSPVIETSATNTSASAKRDLMYDLRLN